MYNLFILTAVYSVYCIDNGSCVLQNICTADMEQVELTHITGRNVKWYNLLGKQFGSFLNFPCLMLSFLKSNSLNSYKFYCGV